MMPVVVFVGRPNVGKSTLFNRLTKTQDALVADFPGLTRDRRYGLANIGSKPCIIVDTGGIGVEDQDIDALMAKQSQRAIEEADLLLLLVDARLGLNPVDEALALRLRKVNKKIILVVNKIDGLDEKTVYADFARLGFTHTIGISATHGQGIANLESAILKETPEATEERIEDEAKSIKIAFIGRPNVGKSTLVNRILGEERVLVCDLPGTTRDAISIPFVRDTVNYTLIDTAGVRRKARVSEKIEKFSIIKTLQSIRAAHICLMLIDAQETITDQDLHLLSFILEAGKGLVVAVNKWDGLDEDHKEKVRTDISRKLKFASFAKIRFISALHGTGVGSLFKDIQEAYASANLKFSTPQLTRLLQDFTSQNPPPLIQGRRIKLRYAHAGGHNPPVIVIHGNQTNKVPKTYQRYLMNAFAEHLHLVGTPLEIIFKGSDNPFKDKRNTLTPRQVRKKKRQLRHHHGKKK